MLNCINSGSDGFLMFNSVFFVSQSYTRRNVSRLLQKLGFYGLAPSHWMTAGLFTRHGKGAIV